MKNIIHFDKYLINESKEITEADLLKWASSIDDKNLLSWCGFSSEKEFEDLSGEKYSKKELISFNFEDLEYVYLNPSNYGL